MAMAKLVVLLAVVLLAILMSDSNAKVSAEQIKGLAEAGGEYHTQRASYGQGSLRSYECPAQCTRRCSQTQYHKPCMFFCQKCCTKCLCVPPGFYGNKGLCPCYNNWKTKSGGPKCP